MQFQHSLAAIPSLGTECQYTIAKNATKFDLCLYFVLQFQTVLYSTFEFSQDTFCLNYATANFKFFCSACDYAACAARRLARLFLHHLTHWSL